MALSPTRSRPILCLGAASSYPGANGFWPKNASPMASLETEGKWKNESTAELGEVILGRASARESSRQVVISELPGMPLWDAVIARLALDRAREQGGKEITPALSRLSEAGRHCLAIGRLS